jgi:hypothetical protein
VVEERMSMELGGMILKGDTEILGGKHTVLVVDE